MSDDWFDRLPKIELHLHLEGAIPLPTLWRLIEEQGCADEVGSFERLRARFVFRDFAHFIDTWVWKNRFLNSLAAFRTAAEAVAADLRRQRVLYAEVFFSPADFARHGLDPLELAAAVREGLDRVDGIDVGLVVDVVRDFGPDNASAVLERLAPSCAPLGILGVGIGGSEQDHPPEPFAGVFARARELGLRRTAHAGEAAGPQSVWGAIRALGVDRLGHATRAEEDEALVEHLLEHRIPLEMCPLSNVATRVVPDLAAHPLKRFLDRGLLVTVNTDDPMMFGNTLADDLRRSSEILGLTVGDIRRLTENAVMSSWLDVEGQDLLRRRVALDPAFADATP